MDDPVVPWTVADTVRHMAGNRAFMTYHVMMTPWALGTPVGCVLGAGIYGVQTLLSSSRPSSSVLQSMATTGLVVGGLGVTVGLTRRIMLGIQGEKAQAKIPWTADGIQQRVDGLSHNFLVRVLDLSAWNGLAAATASLVVLGGPVPLGLAAGPWGVVQALTLGSSLGSLGGIGCVYSVKSAAKAALDDNDDDES